MATNLSKSEATRQKILDAAAKTFRHQGYAATRLNDIADAAAIRAGSIYYHFESKEHLLDQVLDIGIRRVFEAVVREVEALPPGTSSRKILRTAIEAHLTMLLRHGDYTSANIRLFDQVPDDVHDRQARLRGDYDDFWRKLLTAARQAGEIRPDADLTMVRMFLLGALNWSLEWYRPGAKSIAGMAEDVASLLFDGVGATDRPGAGHAPLNSRS